ncbi:ASST-domain-containing protein [Microdochium bolleyi]|uniref:ASST-domain-containing protein n=1 Tax=Microdochium bolleyi TaxID=196109 RepID=A0A136JKJ0_9PEZI|nr:ASST-domain-containing protein [Microdochium bolleyi]
MICICCKAGMKHCLNTLLCMWYCLVTSVAVADVPHHSVADENSVRLWESGVFGPQQNQTFLSSDVRAPVFMVHKFELDQTAPGSHIYLSFPVGGQLQSPVILSARDRSVVYIDPSWNGGGALDYQPYHSQNFLTFWTGKGHICWGTGGCILLNDHYPIFKNITSNHADFIGADNHEFQLTSDGTALINIFYKVNMSATAVGGPEDALIHNNAFQEIDIETGEPRFTWIASDHFTFDESFNEFADDPAIGGGWDWFHMNSIQKTPGGNYLISARHLCVLALISGEDGRVLWRLGGKHNDFLDLSGDGSATGFCFQHHARFVTDSWDEITLFDNRAMRSTAAAAAAAAGEQACSRALRLRLDLDAMTADLVHGWAHPLGVQAWAQGGVQALPGGGAMIGWGKVPSFTEFTAAGDTVLEVQLSPWDTAAGGRHGSSVYRVYKHDYKAYPPWGPSVAVKDGCVYVSWNGATEVDTWEVLRGSDPGNVTSQGVRVPRAGFETAIRIPQTEDLPVVQIAARDKDGNVLGHAGVVDARTGDKLSPNIQFRSLERTRLGPQ